MMLYKIFSLQAVVGGQGARADRPLIVYDKQRSYQATILPTGGCLEFRLHVELYYDSAIIGIYCSLIHLR